MSGITKRSNDSSAWPDKSPDVYLQAGTREIRFSTKMKKTEGGIALWN
jgi:hypothetical protein